MARFNVSSRVPLISWGLRDYGAEGQIGLERTPEEFIATMVAVFREVWRVCREDSVVFVNLGDSYTSGGRDSYCAPSNREVRHTGLTSAIPSRPPLSRGLKPKDLCGIPWRVALALQADGWTLRSDIIWAKPNPMPESVTDRPTKSHEYVFMLSKNQRYYFDGEAVREGETRQVKGSFRVGGSYTNNRSFNNSTNDRDTIDSSTIDEAIGRNIRTVSSEETQLLRLRSDLTTTQREYIISELVRRGLL